MKIISFLEVVKTVKLSDHTTQHSVFSFSIPLRDELDIASRIVFSGIWKANFKNLSI
jgi:hypothetical protein